MATFPTTLPAPLLSGYQGNIGTNMQRTDMDAGAARQRLRYGDTPDTLTLSWRFKPVEMDAFKLFWQTDINRGTDWFLMNLNIGSGVLVYEVRIIGGDFEYQLLPGFNWQVNTKVEVRTI